MFRRSQKALDNALKEQHPETYKLRKKLLESGNVTLENKTRPFARLGRMNIDPMKLQWVGVGVNIKNFSSKPRKINQHNQTKNGLFFQRARFIYSFG